MLDHFVQWKSIYIYMSIPCSKLTLWRNHHVQIISHGEYGCFSYLVLNVYLTINISMFLGKGTNIPSHSQAMAAIEWLSISMNSHEVGLTAELIDILKPSHILLEITRKYSEYISMIYILIKTILIHYNQYIHHNHIMSKLGLINTARLINLHCHPTKCNVKTGGPLGLIISFAWTRLINLQCWNPILFYFPTLFIFKWCPSSILKLKPHEHQNPSLLIIEQLKKTRLFPKWSIFNEQIFVKIISLDSSHTGYPPWKPMSPKVNLTLGGYGKSGIAIITNK